MTPYEKLANAIILRAVEDYRRALRKLCRHEDNRDALHTARELEKFFRSEWFTVLCDLDSKILIDQLKGEFYDCKRISQSSVSA